MNTNNVDITPVENRIENLRLKYEDFDFKTFSVDSRLNVEIILGSTITGDFKASRENCIHLTNIVSKLFKINLVP